MLGFLKGIAGFFRLLLTFIVMFVAGFVGPCFGETEPTEKWVENAFDLTLKGATVETAWDTHGGFHGDGNTFIVLSLSENIEEQITAKNDPEENKSGPWHSLSNADATETYRDIVEEIKDDETGEALIPEIESGYWCCLVGGGKEKQPLGIDLPIEWGGAGNYCFAVYDMENLKLYYYDFDS